MTANNIEVGDLVRLKLPDIGCFSWGEELYNLFQYTDFEVKAIKKKKRDGHTLTLIYPEKMRLIWASALNKPVERVSEIFFWNADEAIPLKLLPTQKDIEGVPVYEFFGMSMIRVSEVPDEQRNELCEFMQGQTTTAPPKGPFDTIYAGDYQNFLNKKAGRPTFWD